VARFSGEDPILFLPEEVAHFAPIPDPEARFRGMSWLTPVIREVMSDKALTDHKLSFTERGATPNMVVKFPIDDLSKFQPWIEKFREQHEGSSNSYKTLFLGAGMDATSVGSNLQEMDLKSVQGAGETRIAAASGVPAVVRWSVGGFGWFVVERGELLERTPPVRGYHDAAVVAPQRTRWRRW
jgi:phage portal protein BeeE